MAAAGYDSTYASTQHKTDHFAVDQRPVILFDGVCNMCNGGVNMVLDWDKKGYYRFAPLQSDAGKQLLVRCGRQPDDISSIVLVEKDSCHIKSEAVLRIATKLNMPLPLLSTLAMPVPRFIRDAAYDQIANNRYTVFGKRSSCRMCEDRFGGRFITT
eukprot:jgi/Chrzof1/8868/Cz03g27110.t1